MQALFSLFRSVFAACRQAVLRKPVAGSATALRQLDRNELPLVAGGSEPSSPYRGW